jgi:hypothetical protein
MIPRIIPSTYYIQCIPYVRISVYTHLCTHMDRYRKQSATFVQFNLPLLQLNCINAALTQCYITCVCDAFSVLALCAACALRARI